jgi:3-oxoacyl-[acyl-carrier protein] reductase
MSSVLVTGSSRGIGKSIALRLAKDGFDVVVHCKNAVDEATQVVQEIKAMGKTSRFLQFDIADREECRSKINQDIEAFGAYYGIVCNAGITRDNAFPSLSDDDWDSVIRTNLDGFYNVVQPATMPMVSARKGGRIVALSSVSGLMGNRGQVNYSASKAGLIGATKSLAIELGKRNITVNCVAPGIIDTEMTSDLNDKYIKEMIPLRRTGKADEVAGLVGYLFSENAGYITRQVISVNGGMF